MINCHEAVISTFNRGVVRQLICQFTGSGKTYTLIKLLERMGFRRVLWLSFQEELVNQSGSAFVVEKFGSAAGLGGEDFVEYIRRNGPISHSGFTLGCIKGDVWEPDCSVVMGSVMTVVRRLD